MQTVMGAMLRGSKWSSGLRNDAEEAGSTLFKAGPSSDWQV